MRDNVITNANRNKCNEKRIQKNVLGVERIRSPLVVLLLHYNIYQFLISLHYFYALTPFSVTIGKAEK